jgi:TRAP-type C4-dicarboxylate transport system permease small subunit
VIPRAVDRALNIAEGVLVLALLAMLVMVFGNVVLRYAFNSGITVSEELSRILFVWLTFLGAVAVMRQDGHLGFDLVVRALPKAGQRVCRIVSDVLMLICCVIFLIGAWEQTAMNMSNAAPVSGVPLGIPYAAAVVSAIGLGALILADLIAMLAGHPIPERSHEIAEPGA